MDALTAEEETTMIEQIELTTTKGRFTGSVAECAEWLAEYQPSSVSAEICGAGVSAEIEVAGTPGAAVYERAIVAALASEAE